jgi:hypothetical protein
MDHYLRIYLRDQLAMGIGWRELARRTARNNAGTDTGAALERVASAIEADVATLDTVMRRLRIAPDPVKNVAVRAAERLGRVKPNGQLRGYSPLSRFEELELLTVGVDAKKQMWLTLRDLAGLATRIPDIDFDDLVARADAQRAELDTHREAAGTAAFVRASRGA